MNTDQTSVATPWHTVATAAAYARRNRATISRALNAGDLLGHRSPSAKPEGRGGDWRIHQDALDAWIRGERPIIEPQRVTRRRTNPAA